MEITSVKLQENGYLVNGSMYVPNDPANRHYQMVQDWIALGNTPDPIETPAEQEAREKRESLAYSQSEIDRTNVCMTADGYQRLSSSEQATMTNYRADHFINIEIGGVAGEVADPVFIPELQVIFDRFGI